MTEKKLLEKRDLRFRLYFRLMDVSLVFVLLILASMILDVTAGIDVMPADKPWGALVAIPAIIGGMILPTFLIVAKFMRDEYAELVWRRTLVILGYVAATGPLAMAVTITLAFYAFGQDEPGIFEPLGQQSTLYDFLIISWGVFMLIYVCTFQFLRWTDSR